MRLSTAFAALLLLTAPAVARGPQDPVDGGFYRSRDGSIVHGPTRQANPAYGKVTATCQDGTSSYSHSHRGTCSRHGGVREWR